MRAFKICERSGKLPRGEIKEKTSFLENFKGCKKNNMFIHNGKEWILENLEDFVGKIVKKDPFLRGAPGKDGKDGMNGRRGETGFGYSGATGATGPRGENGMNGIDGIDGEVGPRGFDGATGPLHPMCKEIYIGDVDGNTILGKDSKQIGIFNTYYGVNIASLSVLSGNYNTVMGANAGMKNIGTGNAFMGPSAGLNNETGSWNTFIGPNAGSDNKHGSKNTFIGPNAGQQADQPEDCIGIGVDSSFSSETPVNQIVIGNNVVSHGDNTITFPNNLKSLPNGCEVNFSSSGGGCLYPVSSSIRWKQDIKDIDSVINT